MSKENSNLNVISELSDLYKAGKYKEALEKHIWFHEASREMSGMGGVRLSFALGLWRKLAEQYPLALEALIDLRDSNREKLLAGKGHFDIFHDFFAINQVLEEDNDTASVFIKIHKNYPEQAAQAYHVTEPLLVEMKEFEICDKYIPDPDEKLAEIQYLHRANMRLMRTNPNFNNDEHKEYSEESYANSVCRLIEILRGVDKQDIAEETQSKALEYLDNKKIRDAI